MPVSSACAACNAHAADRDPLTELTRTAVSSQKDRESLRVYQCMQLDHAEARARILMHRFGLVDWTFRFDQAKCRFGCCSFRTREITLSAPLVLLNAPAEVDDTIRHEIAHALVGPGEGHGPRWRAQAKACGARPVRCYGAWVNQPAPRWLARCPHCDRVWARFRRKRVACGRCCARHSSGRFDARFLLAWRPASTVSSIADPPEA
jgi:predicted SprT family Zn-dependent metalloprotease